MLSGSEIGILTIYYGLLVLVTIYAVHRFHLVRLRLRTASGPHDRSSGLSGWPAVTVQLPVYNEPNVVERLIDAAASLQYPGRLEIQLLDDSTDNTSELAAARIAAHPHRDIRHVRRPERSAFKAGALAHGMTLTDAAFFAVFDADFLPPPDALVRMMPSFADPGVGMVQARWDHLNRDVSLLTRVQAIYLDAHFGVESTARHLSRRFFNFNGTAGIWRRTAIEESGGWSAATLTEDLDLSYRAQLRGWKFVFLPEVTVPAELPDTIGGFHDQQHRWAKGSIQTARRLLGPVLKADLPWRVKLEAAFHLTNNCAYLLTLLLSLFIVPALTIRMRHDLEWVFPADALPFILSTGSVLAFYLEGQRHVGRPRPSTRELLAILPLGIGLSVRNSAAVLEGMFLSGGIFRRTPKRGSGSRLPASRRAAVPVAELLLFIFFCGSVAAFCTMRQLLPVPFLLLFLAGFGHAAGRGLRERFQRATSSE